MPHPHRTAVEVGQQPFVGIGVERVGHFDASQKILQFRADEGVTSVSAIYVQPDARKLAADFSHFRQVVEGAARCGSQCGGHEERDQTHGFVLFHCLKV